MQNEDAATGAWACAMAGRTAQANLLAAVQLQPPIKLQRRVGRPAGRSVAHTFWGQPGQHGHCLSQERPISTQSSASRSAESAHLSAG